MSASRDTYPQTAAAGRTVFDDGRKDAAGEITAIADELLMRFAPGNRRK